MDIEKAVDQSQKISKDLSSLCNDQKKSCQLINGTGFKELHALSDFLAVQLDLSNLESFLKDYLSSMSSLNQKVKKELETFCKRLHLIKEFKWQKFQTLFDCKQGGKGSWIGVYFRKLPNNKVQFVSNHLKCAFTLMPDIYVLKQSQSDGFLLFNKTNTDIKIVQNKRGFNINDFRSLMDVCSMLSNLKALQKLQIQQ